MLFKASSLIASVAVVSGASWEDWKAEYGRVYNGQDEETMRHAVFDANMVEAAELQGQNPEAEFGANEFADWTPEEFKTNFLNYQSSNVTDSMPEADLSDLPSEVADKKDWTGVATTGIKNQGSCGSCWAFSAVEQIESDLILQHGKKIKLGVQELVDCTSRGSGSKRNGCSGGEPSAAYGVIEALGGIEPESSYRYTGRNGVCKFDRSKAAVTVSSFQSVGRNSEPAMKQYVGSTGPLSVCVAAKTWQLYIRGVKTSCDRQVDHCVQLVGYGAKGAEQYWKVRNSWGLFWGEAGNIRLKFGSDLCRISSQPTKAVVNTIRDDVVV